MKISKLFVTKIVVISTLILFLVSCKDKSETGNTSDIFITLDKTEYYPFDVVLVQLSVAATAQEYMGELSGNSITAHQFGDSTLAFVIPALEAAEYPLSLTIGTERVESRLKIKDLPTVDAEAVFEDIKSIFADILKEAKEENDPSVTFLETLQSIFDEELSQLTSEERQQLAAYWHVHSEVFYLPQLNLKGTWQDMKKDIAKLDADYAISVKLFAGAVGVFAPLLYLLKKSPKIGGPLIVIDLAIIMILHKRNNKIMQETLDKVFVPIMESLNANSRSEYDYIVNNWGHLSFSPQVTCRSICADDILGNSPDIAKSIIGTTNLFIVVFEELSKTLDNMRQIIRKLPQLVGSPQSISEITTPQNIELITIDDWTLQIVSGNVSAQKISNTTYRFSTTATDNVEFTFKIIADEIETKIFSALLEINDDVQDFVVINGVKWSTRNLDVGGVFVANPEDYGALYQWGRRTDGHESRTSPNYPTNNNNPANGVVSELDNNGQIPTNHAAYGRFIKQDSHPLDWRSPQNDLLWNTKTNDPCPNGWRLPTVSEWESLLTAERVRTSVNGIAGWRFGSGNNTIFLPATGYKNYSTGALTNVGTHGYYWSTNVNGTFASYLFSNNSSVSIGNNSRALGLPCRCVAE